MFSLSKFVSACGVASRRKSTKLIQEGYIKIDNKIITEPGFKINHKQNSVYYNGKLLKLVSDFVYIALNKPKDYVSTVRTHNSESNLLDLVKIDKRIYPVGRLDKNTRGLILMTNDGQWAEQFLHPKYHIPKTYQVVIHGTMTEKQADKLRKGVLLEDGKTLPTKVKIINSFNCRSMFQITLFEGKKRQIRRMCAEIKLYIIDLQRIKFGNLDLMTLDLPEGKWKYIDKNIIYN